MSFAGQLHERCIRSRRVRRLAELIAARLATDDRVLDIGSGDGSLRREIGRGVRTFAVDVLPRDRAGTFALFDGEALPFRDGAYDVAMLVDVLHHTTDPLRLLREAKRVARRIIIKDHLAEGFAARPTLRFMDRVGNARFGVALPGNYLDRTQWRLLFDRAGLIVHEQTERLDLYPVPFRWIFDRKLHFIAALEHR